MITQLAHWRMFFAEYLDFMSSTASHDGVHLIDSHCEFSPAPKSRYSIKSAVREASANETLDFYRREVAVLAADSEIFQQQLDKIKETIDHQYSLQLQLQESEETVMKLRNQMSKLQVFVCPSGLSVPFLMPLSIASIIGFSSFNIPMHLIRELSILVS